MSLQHLAKLTKMDEKMIIVILVLNIRILYHSIQIQIYVSGFQLIFGVGVKLFQKKNVLLMNIIRDCNGATQWLQLGNMRITNG